MVMRVGGPGGEATCSVCLAVEGEDKRVRRRYVSAQNLQPGESHRILRCDDVPVFRPAHSRQPGRRIDPGMRVGLIVLTEGRRRGPDQHGGTEARRRTEDSGQRLARDHRVVRAGLWPALGIGEEDITNNA